MTQVLGALALSLSLCAEPAPVRPGAASPALADSVGKCQASVKLLQERLQARLAEALSAGGPAAAVLVCRDEAPAIAARISREQGVAVGRTSDRLRNPANAPPAWAAAAVRAARGQRVAAVGEAVFDLGDRVGLLRPIAAGAPCLACHGPAASMAPEVRTALSKAYPSDQANGYSAGELRGFFWAVARK